MSDYNSTPLKPARDVTPPPGWDLAEQFDPFEASLGPYFQRMHDGAHEFAFISTTAISTRKASLTAARC